MTSINKAYEYLLFFLLIQKTVALHSYNFVSKVRQHAKQTQVFPRSR